MPEPVSERPRLRTLKLHDLQTRRLEAVMAPRPEPAAPAAGGPIPVLLVEDDADQREILQRTLERQGFTVTAVADGDACLAAVAGQAFSLILLDYTLPRGNGLEVLTALRARRVRSPVVMVTAQGDERLAVEATAAGGMDFVVKTPGYHLTLATVLRKVLAQHELAMENERLHRETERRLRDAEALVQICCALSSTLEWKALLPRVAGGVARALDMDRGVLFSHEDGRVQVLGAHFADGRADEQAYLEFRRGPRPMSELPFLAAGIRRREPLLLNDPAQDPLVPRLGGGGQPGALLVLPLLRGDAVTGVLVLDRAARGPIPPSHAILGTAVAGHVALALEHARLYEDAQRTLAELKQAQDRLVCGETLRALGELAGGAAHHLNNLLAVISGRAQLLLREVEDGGLRRPLEIIERTARDGAEVVRRIQQFARTRQVSEPEAVDLSQLVREVVEMTRVRWHDSAIAQGVAIRVACRLGDVPAVSGNPAELREVITNLVLNAVDALPGGGEIRIRTRAEGDQVVLEVQDDGPGMSPDVRRRALEPFFTTKGVRRMGLGLSVNYGIVRQHAGELTLDSTEGVGTTVTVRLPARPPRAAAERPAAAIHGRPLRILIVDDEAEVRDALGDLLDAEGHAVVLAAGGAEALAYLEHGPRPDLVLTDLGMPNMTGAELAREIKRGWPGLPVGLVTGWGDQPNGIGDGAADFILSKPVDVARLLDAAVRAVGAAGRR